MGRFQCTRCGRCCKETLFSTGKYLFGLYLDPAEASWFPKESVFPLLGRGDPPVATAFQLGLNRCPNFEDSGGTGACRIYPNRPLSCIAYPVISPTKVAPGCPGVERSGDGVDPESLSIEMAAHYRKTEQMISRPDNQWFWPLNLRQWIPMEAS